MGQYFLISGAIFVPSFIVISLLMPELHTVNGNKMRTKRCWYIENGRGCSTISPLFKVYHTNSYETKFGQNRLSTL